ncbi:MAG: hypothetical protein ACI9EB_000541 [Pseudomonas sp.]|jgi:hypothetical protein
MESKIPLPTDNIYKFVALFSLILLISSFGAIIVATNSANAVVFEHWVELETLQAQEKLSVEQTSRLKALERKIEVTISDKKTFIQLSGAGAAFGLFGIIFGFGYWHKKIQPLADQMAVTQLELARLQLLSLRADLKAKGVEVDAP